MGAFLEKPKTDKSVGSGEGNGLRFGLSSMQGWRIEMEDAHYAKIGLPYGLGNCSFFAVFDGHAGARVSAHCAENLLDSIVQSDDFIKNIVSTNDGENDTSGDQIEQVIHGIKTGFLKLDEKMKSLPEVLSGEDKSGSTAVCCLISPTHYFFANCGDSRAVLSRTGKAFFSTLDHKPINPQEKERIQKAGGSVMIQRVNGSLAVSRALGDYEYKQVEGRGPCEQLVSPEPEITAQTRDDANDEFLLLACDGVWDVMTNDDLCDFVRHQLTINDDIESICSSIIDTCLHKGSKDNMSVVVVALPGSPRPSEEARKRDTELNELLEKKVQEILSKNNDLTVSGVVQNLMYEDIGHLPPGGGLDSKRTIVEEAYYRIYPHKKESLNETSDKNDHVDSLD